MSSSTPQPHFPSSPLAPPPQLLLFGDSLTQSCTSTSFQTQLSTLYLRRLDILNRGFSGYNTTMSLSLLHSFFPSNPPSKTTPHVLGMTVFFGANDAVLPGNAQHVPLATYITNLREILQWEGLKSHETAVILITPPPVDEYQLNEPTRTAGNTARYAKACREVGDEVGVAVLDLWSIFMRGAGWDGRSAVGEGLPGSKEGGRNEVLGQLLSDGLHFTEKGYEVWYEELVKLIDGDERLVGLRVGGNGARCRVWYPEWREMLGLPSPEL